MNDIEDMGYEEWRNSLNESDRLQVKLLDAWAQSRDNLPGSDPEGNKLIDDPKTTDEIMDELQPMFPVSREIIAYYLSYNEFGFTTDDSGALKWAIWRRPPKIQ